jgi:hypothetical protein
LYAITPASPPEIPEVALSAVGVTTFVGTEDLFSRRPLGDEGDAAAFALAAKLIFSVSGNNSMHRSDFLGCLR